MSDTAQQQLTEILNERAGQLGYEDWLGAFHEYQDDPGAGVDWPTGPWPVVDHHGRPRRCEFWRAVYIDDPVHLDLPPGSIRLGVVGDDDGNDGVRWLVPAVIPGVS